MLTGDEKTLPPCPVLLLLSDRGVLCPFVAINLNSPQDELQAMVTPPKALPSTPPRGGVANPLVSCRRMSVSEEGNH